MKTHIFKIYGYVQGVGFRYYTLKKAHLLDIKGYVKNMSDGSVYVEAQGNEEKIKMFKEYLKRGPIYSEVKEIKEEIIESNYEFQDFKIEV